jgi:sulfoxide reductase heme-binding subunit YedZ
MARGFIFSAKVVEKRIKPLLFILALLPFGWLLWQLYYAVQGLPNGLGANPFSASNFFTGKWALRFLLLTLAITPARQLTGWNDFGRLRRMFGLFAFFYALMHLTSYVVIDHFFDWHTIWKDILKRLYITLGMTALLILLPLAITSTNRMVRRLGPKNWQNLHRMVYVAAILAVIHFYLLVKADVREPLLYIAILACLLGYRLMKARFWQKKSQAMATAALTPSE